MEDFKFGVQTVKDPHSLREAACVQPGRGGVDTSVPLDRC